jgi:nitrate/nitrite transport system substrate-binding protein
MRHLIAALAGWAVLSGALQAQDLEVTDLTIGFIKLTDMAPLAIAQEKGYFADEGLTVTLAVQPNWNAIQSGVLDGSLQAAHMLAPLPISTLLDDGEPEIVTPLSMDLNGNAVTVANWVWAEMRSHIPSNTDGTPQHPISAAALVPLFTVFKEEGLQMDFSVVHRFSNHNYEIRHWLAAGGLHPGFYAPDNDSGQIKADIFLSVFPPTELPKALQADLIFGYSVGEPWNQAAVKGKFGVPVITDHNIMPMNPEKVLGLRADFVAANPNTTKALLRAMIRAGMWLDAEGGANRVEAVEILARPDYLGADPAILSASMTGTFEFEPGDIRPVPEFNIFFRDYATYPYYSDAVWLMTQMRRWGEIAEPQTDAWYHEMARKVYRPDIYLEAARGLVEAGLAAESDFPWDSDGFRPVLNGMIDGVPYDGKTPNAYIDSLSIGLKGNQRIVGDDIQG